MSRDQAAPIVVFTYNRAEHAARVLKSLDSNPAFANSQVTIYCDGVKKPEHAEAVAANRTAVRRLAPKGARIVERAENFGLAKSIITGVSEHVAEHGKVIVVEDDLVFSPGTLDFLNEGLRRYQDHDRVMHVAAYMFPTMTRFEKPFFYREATCWGWATWDRAWKHFNPDPHALLAEIDRRGARKDFDIRGSMFFYHMLKLQADGKLDSWAIRWYASMYLQGGLSLHPHKSYVENLGFDGTGVHCNVDDRFIVETTSRLPREWPTEIVESEQAIVDMIAYRKSAKDLKMRIRRRVAQVLNRLNPFE